MIDRGRFGKGSGGGPAYANPPTGIPDIKMPIKLKQKPARLITTERGSTLIK